MGKMNLKSSREQLEKRGFAGTEKIAEYEHLDDAAIIKLIQSDNAVERTAAAVITGIRRIPGSLPLLCESLKKEKKLYTKIAICDAFEKFGIAVLQYLLPMLGEIGTNQHKKIDPVDINKKSFPLPRDIVARIIIRIGSPALPFLEDLIENGNYKQRLEAVDAIGHIAFNYRGVQKTYSLRGQRGVGPLISPAGLPAVPKTDFLEPPNNNFRSERVLLNTYKNSNDELLKWKIIRAFQSFDSAEVRLILEGVKNGDNPVFKEEAARSLKQIEKRRL